MTTGFAALRRLVKSDISVNVGNPKGCFVLVAFRLGHALRSRQPNIPVLTPIYGVLYRVIIEWVLGIEIPWKTTIGHSTRLYHGTALVINDKAILGDRVILRHGVTIGHLGPGLPAPRIGDDVEFGSNSIVIGDIDVGDRTIIGSGAVLTKSVPADSVVRGNPAQIFPRSTAV